MQNLVDTQKQYNFNLLNFNLSIVSCPLFFFPKSQGWPEVVFIQGGTIYTNVQNKFHISYFGFPPVTKKTSQAIPSGNFLLSF